MRSRLNKVNKVKEVWRNSGGDIRKTVNYILALKDKSVLVDTIAQVLGKKHSLKLDVVCALIPAACDLVAETEHEKWAVLSMDAIIAMNEMFADHVRSVCSAHPSSGIDLHFEEKLEYCRRAKADLVGLRPKLADLKAHRSPLVASKSLELDKVIASSFV